MKIAAVSDLHGLVLPDIPACDLLLIGGDVTPVFDHSLPTQYEYLNGEFRRWLQRVPADAIVGIAGNHDYIFDLDPGRVPADLRWTYLQDSGTEVKGLKIWGSPWSIEFGGWPFMEKEPQLAKRWAAIPDDTDILLVHGPPLGYGDRNTRGRECGSPSLLAAIDRVQPRLCVFGHIHEAHGRWKRGGTELANVSCVNGDYQPTHGAEVFDSSGGPMSSR
jgi:Icc-related predicted phosphoesterase